KYTVRGSMILAIRLKSGGDDASPQFTIAAMVPERARDIFRLSFYTDLTDAEIREWVIPNILESFPSLSEADGGDIAVSRVRGEMALVGPVAENLNLSAFYFAVATTPELRPFIFMNETNNAFSEKTLAPYFHMGDLEPMASS